MITAKSSFVEEKYTAQYYSGNGCLYVSGAGGVLKGGSMTLQEILESVKSGSVSVEEAERILKKKVMKKWSMRSWIQAVRQEPVSQK